MVDMHIPADVLSDIRRIVKHGVENNQVPRTRLIVLQPDDRHRMARVLEVYRRSVRLPDLLNLLSGKICIFGDRDARLEVLLDHV